MLILLNQHKEPEKCPSCGLEEDKVIVCRHCRHEYELNKRTDWRPIIIVVILVLFSTIGLTFFAWYWEATNEYYPYTGTYIEWILEGISKFIKTLKRLW